MPTPGPSELVFAIHGPVARDDLPELCDRVCAFLAESPAAIAYCDVSAADPDAVCVDALARLQLAAKRRGCVITLRNASSALVGLVELMGLTHVLARDQTARHV